MWAYGLVKRDNVFSVEEVYFKTYYNNPHSITENCNVVGDDKKDVITTLKMMIKDIEKAEVYFEFDGSKVLTKNIGE